MEPKEMFCCACKKPLAQGETVWVIIHSLEVWVGYAVNAVRHYKDKLFCEECVDYEKTKKKVMPQRMKEDPEKKIDYLSCGACKKKLFEGDIFFHFWATLEEKNQKTGKFEHTIFPLYFWCYECGIEHDGIDVHEQKISEILEDPWNQKKEVCEVKSPETWKKIMLPLKEKDIILLRMLGWRGALNQWSVSRNIRAAMEFNQK